jgi:putative oxidoreductase
MGRNNQLIIAGGLSFLAALLHIGCIFGGPDWYLFFGAGERMAALSAEGSSYPTFVTLGIASVLIGWGLYALSGAGVIFKLPLLKTC